MTKDPNGSTLASVQMEVTASAMVFKAALRMRASPSVGDKKLQKSTSSATEAKSAGQSKNFPNMHSVTLPKAAVLMTSPRPTS